MAYLLILKNNRAEFRREIKMYNPNSSIFSEAGDLWKKKIHIQMGHF